MQHGNHGDGNKPGNKKKAYIIAWSFNNPTEMLAAIMDENEEGAIRQVEKAYEGAPDFMILESREADEEELKALKELQDQQKTENKRTLH